MSVPNFPERLFLGSSHFAILIISRLCWSHPFGEFFHVMLLTGSCDGDWLVDLPAASPSLLGIQLLHFPALGAPMWLSSRQRMWAEWWTLFPFWTMKLSHMQYEFCFSPVEFEVPVRHPELCVWSSGEKSELEIKSLTEMWLSRGWRMVPPEDHQHLISKATPKSQRYILRRKEKKKNKVNFSWKWRKERVSRRQ